MTVVLDASAILAYLQGEPGEDAVEQALGDGSTCGAANWSEVAQKIRASGRDWPLARTLLRSYELQVADVTIEDAESAAEQWTRGSGLSLGDRLCIALADRLDVDVLTADLAWGAEGRIRQIR